MPWGALKAILIGGGALVLLGIVAWPFIQRSGLFAGSVIIESTRAALLDGQAEVGRKVKIVSLVPKDAIRSIDEPRFVSAAEAASQLRPDEPVIGLEIDGDARAYSTFMLSAHEIVNDVVGGVPVAITW